MDVYEGHTHSFVVKIWLEDETEDAEALTWSGYITDVSNGERHYIKSLEEITAFIAPYLVEMGVRLEQPANRRRKWWQWWKA